MQLLLAPPHSAAAAAETADFSSGEAAIYGAAIAGGAALLAAVFTAVLNALFQRRLTARAETTAATEARATRITEQLSQLYGPLLLLTTQSLALARKLREDQPDPNAWHLLDHLDEVVEHPTEKAIAEQVISINGEIERLIFAHAGLLKDGEVPESFEDFLGHYRLLKIAFDDAEQKRPIRRDVTAGRFETYPPDFDSDVKSAYDALLKERKALPFGD